MPSSGKQHLLGMCDHVSFPATTSRRARPCRYGRRAAAMAQLAVHRPLDEGDLHDDLRPHPVRAQARQAVAFVNGGFAISSASSRARRSSSSFVSKPVPTLPAKTKSSLLEVADQQRAEADASALRIGEAADDELLRRLAFHLQPVRRAAVLVRRVAPLGDDAFPALAARALPRLRIVERGDALRAAVASGSVVSSARRSSSGSAVTSRPSSHRMSNTW